MVEELSTIFDAVSADAEASNYSEAVIDRNVLGKQSFPTRKKSFGYLRQMYVLDPDERSFRVLRFLWEADPSARPILAMLFSLSRDPILADTADIVLETPVNEPFTYTVLSTALGDLYGEKYSFKSARSTGQNLASSWRQSGHLKGHRGKVRVRAVATPASAAFAVFLGYQEGGRGSLLLESPFARVLDTGLPGVHSLLVLASSYGWIDYKRFGDVVEISVEGLVHQVEAE